MIVGSFSPEGGAGRRIRPLALAATLVLALAAGGCSSRLSGFKGSLGDVAAGGAGQSQPGELPELARRYDARPGEKRASLTYAAALRANRQHAQAVAVLQRASLANVGDKEVAAAYGKALADVGRFKEAMEVLSGAHGADRPDWRILSTQGAISDQMGEHERARDYYRQALQLSPDEPNVLANFGLSYVLTRDLAKAEELLRRAAAHPKADERVRANLALVESLKAQGGRAAQGQSKAATARR